MEKAAPVRAWIIDDTRIPKKGKHSVGVARQYCGELGGQDSCQVAVILSGASDHSSLPVALRLYLPETWAKDEPPRATRHARRARILDEAADRARPK